MQIYSIEAEDFCCFPELNLKLKDRGLVWISGENKDSDAAENNGCGKTTLLKSLVWGLYNQSIDGVKGDKVIRDGADKAVVKIKLEDDRGNFWTIVRERKKGSPKVSLFLPDGEELKISKEDVQDKIDRMVGLDFSAFKNTVLYGQNDTSRFANPRTRDSERKDMLNKILRMDIFKDCHDYVLKERKRIKTEVIKIETKKDNVEEQYFVIKDDLERTIGINDGFENDKKERIEVYRSKAKDLKQEALDCREEADNVEVEHVCDIEECQIEIVELHKKIKKGKQDKEKVDKLNEKLEELEEESDELSNKIYNYSNDLKHFNEQLKRLNGDKCPICESDLNKGSPFKLKQNLKSDIDEIEEKKSDIEEERKKIRKKIERLNKDIVDLRDNIDIGNGAERQIISLEKLIEAEERAEEKADLKRESILSKAAGYIERAKEQLNFSKEVSLEENPYEEMINDLNSKKRKKGEELKELKKELKELSEELAKVEFWCFGFSGKGLPSFLLDSIMPFLTERSNEYLEILSDGDIEIEFRTQKELKRDKNEVRDTIEIAHLIEGVEGYPPSGGQLKKIEIATDFALMDLVSTREDINVNLLCLDEILDGLDSEGRSRVLVLLQKLKTERGGSIFVISHEVDMSEIFEDSIMVVKEDGMSMLVE